MTWLQGSEKEPGRGRRAAAMHAAEAIAAQAEHAGDVEGDSADGGEWQVDDEEMPARESGRGSFDPVNSPVIKGPRTARKKNSEHLAGAHLRQTSVSGLHGTASKLPLITQPRAW